MFGQGPVEAAERLEKFRLQRTKVAANAEEAALHGRITLLKDNPLVHPVFKDTGRIHSTVQGPMSLERGDHVAHWFDDLAIPGVEVSPGWAAGKVVGQCDGRATVYYHCDRLNVDHDMLDKDYGTAWVFLKRGYASWSDDAPPWTDGDLPSCTVAVRHNFLDTHCACNNSLFNS